jgi:hypothetical protein
VFPIELGPALVGVLALGLVVIVVVAVWVALRRDDHDDPGVD